MKTQLNHPEQKEKNTVQRVQQEATHSGNANIADHRPAIVSQRKLMATMQAMPKGINSPIQLKEKESVTSKDKFITAGMASPNWDYQEVKGRDIKGIKEIREIEKHKGEDVVKTTDTATRRVFSSKQHFKVRKGMFSTPYLRTKVTYNETALVQYEVANPETRFYHATRTSNMDNIAANGLNPTANNDERPLFQAEYNSKGFNYFGITPQVAIDYGKGPLKRKFVLLSFRMPVGARFEADPEMLSAGRTVRAIPVTDIFVVRGDDSEVPLTAMRSNGSEKGASD